MGPEAVTGKNDGNGNYSTVKLQAVDIRQLFLVVACFMIQLTTRPEHTRVQIITLL
jgi:hypothetical protein